MIMWAIKGPDGRLITKKRFGVCAEDAWWIFLGKPKCPPSRLRDDIDTITASGYRAVKVEVREVEG